MASGIVRMLLAVWDDKIEIPAKVGFMKQSIARGVASICFLAVCASLSIEPSSSQPPHKRPQFGCNHLSCWSMSSARTSADTSDRIGEETFRKMIRLIIHDAYRRNPKPLPVIVFLHGDHTGQPRLELDKLVDDFLGTFGIVFGIRDYRSPVLHFLIGEQSKIRHSWLNTQAASTFLRLLPGMAPRWRRF